MVRSKATDFSYDEISEKYEEWLKFSASSKDGAIISYRSILYWAKNDANPDDYKRVNENCQKILSDKCIFLPTDWDFASLLYQLKGHQYICTSFDGKNGIWWRKTDKIHHWILDKGFTIRKCMSEDLVEVFYKQLSEIENEYQQYDPNDERIELLNKKQDSIHKIIIKLKSTSQKNNILSESKEQFYDGDFINKKDSNPYLLCFNNGVIDFKTNTFRKGMPEDYLTICTGIDYIEDLSDPKYKIIIDEINNIMDSIFPNPDLKRYMWEHLASTLIGTCINQIIHMYIGSGSNGKSILTDLMRHALGQYNGVVPLSLITEKRPSVGGTSSEIVQLRSVRYGVFHEPSKGMKLNEGPLKNITGGDMIQGRQLYQENETFMPQFSLVMCSNVLMEIDATDDGTWRRIKVVPFESKFIEENEKAMYPNHKHLYPKDKSLKERLPELAPVFISMLIKKAFETKGYIKDCDIVLEKSNEYRRRQDCIRLFVEERIIKTDNPNNILRQQEISTSFKYWFEENCGGGFNKQPKTSEIFDALDKLLQPRQLLFKGKNTEGWIGYIYSNDTADTHDTHDRLFNDTLFNE